MIWMHKVIWVCGRATFKWVLVTKAEFARTAHLTGVMIKLKAAKLAAGGAIVLCAGSGVWYGPGWIERGGWDRDRGPARSERVVAAPEPGSLVILAVGVAGLIAVRWR